MVNVEVLKLRATLADRVLRDISRDVAGADSAEVKSSPGCRSHCLVATAYLAMATHALFESASGYAIFEVKLKESVGAMTKAVQESLDDLAKFGKMVTLISFSPFKSAAHALENANDISEGEPAYSVLCFAA